MTDHAIVDSLVHPDALNEVFDVVDTDGDGVLILHDFISVRTSFISRRQAT